MVKVRITFPSELLSPGTLAFDRGDDIFFSDYFLRSGFGYNEVDGRIRKISISISSPQVPGKPVDVQVSLERTSATVLWLPPLSDGASQIDQYTISVSPSGKTFNASGSANQVVISSLIPNTTYQPVVWMRVHPGLSLGLLQSFLALPRDT